MNIRIYKLLTRVTCAGIQAGPDALLTLVKHAISSIDIYSPLSTDIEEDSFRYRFAKRLLNQRHDH